MRKRFSAAAAFGLLLVLASAPASGQGRLAGAQTPQSQGATLQGGVGAAGAQGTVAAPSPLIGGETAGYKLGPGDKIRVITYGETALTGEFFVDGSGTVSFPLLGPLHAGDSTPQEFQKVVETALKDGYIKEPRVSVEVLTFRPFYILGEVNKPGTYPYTNGLTVLNAVATAAGFTYRANTKRVSIKRLGETKEETRPLTPDLAVAPGDTIRISERYF